MGNNFDKDVQVWKNSKEKHFMVSDMLMNLHSILKVTENSEMEVLSRGLQTTDISSLDLSFPSNTDIIASKELSDNVSETCELQVLEELNMDEDDLDASGTASISEMRSEQLFFKEIITDESESSKIAYDSIDTIVKSTVEGGWTGMDAVEVESLQSSHCQSEPPSYQVIGDNIDLYMSKQNTWPKTVKIKAFTGFL